MTEAGPISRGRIAILATLLALAIASWGVLAWQAGSGDPKAMDLTMGGDAVLFLAVWVVMMVAVMFPTAAPMILAFDRVYSARRDRGVPFVPTWVFTGTYLLLWALFGVAAYALALGAQDTAMMFPWLMENAARLGGGVLILAGLYQLTPLKTACLAQCRSPMGFILSSWRDGYDGAVRMGLEHGAYCIGCCWLLFVILLPLGMMNVAATAVITLLIFAEKSLPAGETIARVAAVALVLWGLLVLVNPALLPTTLGSGSMQGM